MIKNKATIAARRSQVSTGLAQRMTYRQIADALDVSHVTIVGDVKELRRQWAESIGAAEVVFADSAMSLDRWQAKVEGSLDQLHVERLPGAVDTLVRINDQRLKLFGLYPKAGAGDEQDIPTGPIEISFQYIPAGNSRLVTSSLEDDPIEDVTYGALGAGGQQ